jgi:hypothetical protein
MVVVVLFIPGRDDQLSFLEKGFEVMDFEPFVLVPAALPRLQTRFGVLSEVLVK